VAVARDYQGWNPPDPLDPEVESALAFLDQLTDQQDISGSVAKIDAYGVVESEVALGSASLWLQVGDGWNRVIWTVPSGRSYEWEWDVLRGPQQVRALITGRGCERVAYLGKRRVTEELLLEGEALDASAALLGPLLRRSGLGLEIRERPAF